MYNYIQQQAPGQLALPDQQGMMMPGCHGNYQPYMPYPQKGMVQNPIMPAPPKTPNIPNMPLMPNIPNMPIMPNIPNMPNMPTTTPGLPSMPMYPTTPSLPFPPQQGQQGMQPISPPDFGFEEGPPTLTDIGYTPAYLRTQIGRHVKIEFLLGTNTFIDREGVLMNVGINYVIIQEVETDDLLLCDMYSIRFVRFYY